MRNRVEALLAGVSLSIVSVMIAPKAMAQSAAATTASSGAKVNGRPRALSHDLQLAANGIVFVNPPYFLQNSFISVSHFNCNQ